MSHRVEITKEMLEKYISDNCMEFTLEEVEALMDSEVEKPEDEMDTELVDLCATVLAKAYNPDFKEGKPAEMYRPWEDENKNGAENTDSAKPDKKKVVPFKRILLVAAVLVVIFAVALPAGAKLFGNNTSDGIIEFYNDFFKINLNKDESTTANSDDLVNQMILDSLNTLMLPQILLSDEYEKKVQTEQGDQMTTIWLFVNNVNEKITGYIMITQYKTADHNMTNGFGNIPDNTYRYVKELLIDGQKVIVFGNDEKSYINYSDGSTNYEIALICDFETMVSIAETINVKG